MPSDTIAIQDQPSKFECIVDSLPKAKISWYLNDKELTIKDNVKFETDAKTNATFLSIAKISSVHFGKYTIKASNNVAEVEHNFNVNVLETPKISGKLENVTVSEGQEARFTIKLSGGKPKPTIKWFFEEEEIITTTSEEYEVIETEDSFILIIKSVKPINSGSYHAVLVNEAGQLKSNIANLVVNSM